MREMQWESISFGQVHITDSFLREGLDLEIQYLLSLDEKRLLAGFEETAGIRPKAIRYGGWESLEIRGHTMGHYLTALSQLWAMERNQEAYERIERIINTLSQCQREDGYLSAFPEVLFDNVEQEKPAWVPWYTMHKIISGITAAWKYTGIQKAYDIMERLADWVSNRALSWTEEIRQIVLSVEYGGMNDCLYDIFQITGNIKYAMAAHQFDEIPLFEHMAKNQDQLDGLHANTTIPKILGALKRYVVMEEKSPLYLAAAKNFWQMVIEHHTYITGGNSEWEHFGQPNVLDAERTEYNCETCNVYNMLKLSALLFQITGEKKYADYYERAYINSILSSQNHETGMTTYFQPMATGFFKVYSRPYDNFWCCTGTGMESFTKQCEHIYYAQEDCLCINRFVSSEINWVQKGVQIEIEANLLEEQPISITIKEILEQSKYMELRVRIPEWTTDLYRLELSKEMKERIFWYIQDGYFVLAGEWHSKDTLQVFFPMQLQQECLPDNEDVLAFRYGPFVLSANLGTEKMDTTTTGVEVTVPMKDESIPDNIFLPKDTIAQAQKVSNAIAFQVLDDKGESLLFEPHFLKNNVRYGIYFKQI